MINLLLSIAVGIAFAKPLSLDQWIEQEKKIAVEKIVLNISPAGAAPGAVMASPSRKDPDYYFHWIRDAALVFGSISGLPATQKFLLDFVNLTLLNQKTKTLTGLGEPRFEMDGRPYNGPWSRPQNDGPALRALTLLPLAFQMLDVGKKAFVEQTLYPVLRTDLDYVAISWPLTCYDLWEEWSGLHFYTRVVQWRALTEGARIAHRLGEPETARGYLAQAAALRPKIMEHLDAGRGRVLSTLGPDGGTAQKPSNLDVSVVLAALHANAHQSAKNWFFGPTDPWVLATAAKLKDEFNRVYHINQNGLIGTAIGRYTEDVYFGGNPWFLTTLAYAELHYRVALGFLEKGQVEIPDLATGFFMGLGPKRDLQTVVQWLLLEGDAYLERVRIHMNADGSMSEQFDRNTGTMLSAHDLTWSYAAFVTAADAREQLIKAKIQ